MSEYVAPCHLSSGVVSIFDGIILIAIILVALIGNVITIIAFIKFRTLHTVTNFFIASLAAADILVSVLPMPMTFAVYVCSWLPKSQPQSNANAAYLVCDIWSSSVSIYSLTTIALDRFFAIKWPFTHQRIVTENVAAIAVGLCWVATLLVAIMILIIKDRNTYTLFIIIVAYALPVTIMLISYVSIAIIAHRHAKKINALEICTRYNARKVLKNRKTSSSLSQDDESKFTEKANGVENGESNSSDDCEVTANKGAIENATENDPKNVRFTPTNYYEQRPNGEFFVNSTTITASIANGTKALESIVPSNGQTVTTNFEVVTENIYHRSEVAVSNDVKMRVSNSIVSMPKRNSRLSLSWKRSTLRHGRSLKREFKAAKTLALVMGSFILLWTPFMSINIMYFAAPHAMLDYSMVKYFKFLHYFNSALNPVLYILLNRQWKAAFQQLLCSWRNQRPEIDATNRSDLLGW